MKITETQRLLVRQMTLDDAAFILEQLNDPGFIQNIGDRGVRTLYDACGYINNVLTNYEKFGFWLYIVELKESGEPIGMCGLIKRDYLEDIDIGYSFLERFWGKGYAYEAASAVMDYAHNTLGINRVVAITSPDNQGSINVLKKLGLEFDRMIIVPGETEETRLFVPKINTVRLDQAFERLNTYTEREAALDSRFRELILKGEDEQLYRINPYRLGAQWKMDAHAILLWLLYSSQVGLFDLNWESHCPHCSDVNNISARLGSIGHEGNCKMCQVDYTLHSDENIEVTFTINRAIRAVRPNIKNFLSYNEYFLGTFDATNPFELDLNRPGKYFLAAFQGIRLGSVYRINVETTYPPLDEAHVTFFPEVTSPRQSEAGLGKIKIHAGGATQLLGLYRDDYQDVPQTERVTGLKIMLMPQFKQIFASESLSQRESLSVKSLTLMFTDITGSTAMYKQFGDIRAYNLVRDHFEVLFREIEKHHGVTVKTIGDAVMAAFPSADDAVRAALEVQRSIREFNRGRLPEQGVILLKIGLHNGSAIAVNLNDRLDYFGNMVNMAARIQSKSRSEEILMSEALYHDANVKQILASDPHLVVVDSLFELHGIGEQRLYGVVSQTG